MRHIYMLLFALSMGWFCSAETVITNGEKPINHRAGYEIQLNELLRIETTDNRYYFKDIADIQVAQDSSIFVKDDDQLLQFLPNGQFVKNFCRIGEGPQEIHQLSFFALDQNKLVLTSATPVEIVVFDIKTQKLIREFKIEGDKMGKSISLFHVDGNYYFWKDDSSYYSGKGTVATIGREIMAVSPEGKILENHFKMNTQFLISHQPFSMVFPWANPLNVAMGKNKVFLTNTYGYKISLLNTDTFKIERTFSRKYKPVKLTEANKQFLHFSPLFILKNKGKTFWESAGVDLPKNFQDIQKLLVNKDKLWVVTSTVKDGNKVLVDVFNPEGVYLDNFYLTVPRGISPYAAYRWLYTIDNQGALYTVETDAADEPIIKKYGIINAIQKTEPKAVDKIKK